jgi:hypothetical protein
MGLKKIDFNANDVINGNACGGITSNPATIIPKSPQSYSPPYSKITNNLSRYKEMYHTIQNMVLPPW